MILTLKSFARKMEGDLNGAMGRKTAPDRKWTYSKTGMWAMLSCSAALAVVGLVICIMAAARDRTPALAIGLLLVLLGTWLILTAVKQKNNLDLLTRHFEDLSQEAKAEIVRSLMKSNDKGSGDILRLIEKLMNLVFGKK